MLFTMVLSCVHDRRLNLTEAGIFALQKSLLSDFSVEFFFFSCAFVRHAAIATREKKSLLIYCIY